MKIADAMLYDAKRLGRNQVVWSSETGEQWIEETGPKEGSENIDPGNLTALMNYPELDTGNCDLFYEMAAKIFYGQEPADYFDEFVAEYKSRGGDEIIKEATEAYQAGKVFLCR